MAESSYIDSLLGGLAADVKRAIGTAFTYALNNLRLGPFDAGTRARNFQWYWLSGTTSSVAGQEFTIAHGLGRTPYVAMQVAPLNAVNSQIVPLVVSRAADGTRIYLTSSSTSAAISLLVE